MKILYLSSNTFVRKSSCLKRLWLTTKLVRPCLHPTKLQVEGRFHTFFLIGFLTLHYITTVSVTRLAIPKMKLLRCRRKRNKDTKKRGKETMLQPRIILYPLCLLSLFSCKIIFLRSSSIQKFSIKGIEICLSFGKSNNSP